MAMSQETRRYLDQVLDAMALDAKRELRDLAVERKERGGVVNTAWFDQTVRELRASYEAALEEIVRTFGRGLNRALANEADRLDGFLASGRDLNGGR